MKALLLFLAIAAAIGGSFAYIKYTEKPGAPEDFQPTDFYECAKYFPVVESYPRRCIGKFGAQFTEDIGNAAEMKNSITVSTPQPGAMVASPLRIQGKALPEWFADNYLSVEIFSKGGKRLGKGTINVKDIAIGGKIYSFDGTADFETPGFERSGTVVIYNSADRSEELRIPVQFR